MTPAARRVALVTGATSGAGLATATELARRGASVHLLARDSAQAAATRRLIIANSGNRSISYDLADLCDFDSVWHYAAAFRNRYDRLDVLIHNAAKLYPSYQENGDGLELTFAGQVVGPFLLTWLLLPDLLAAAPSRVIVVCSAGMYAQPLTRSMTPAGPERYRARSAYAKANRAQAALTAEWAKRVPSQDVAFHAIHPDGTDAADTIVWLATAGSSRLRSGLFWHNRRPRPVRLAPLPDLAAARKASLLWDYVADLARQ